MGYRIYANPSLAVYLEEGVLKEENGGTGYNTLDFLYNRYKAIFKSKIDKVNGPISLDSEGKIINEDIVNGLSTGITIEGLKTINTGTTHEYTITSYDYMDTYTVVALAGSVTVNGDKITYTAPNNGGEYGFKVNNREFRITVVEPHVARPSIVSPVNNATGLGSSVNFTSSAFTVNNGIDTHTGSDWELATDSGFTTVVSSVVNGSSNKESYTVTGLLPNTSYYARVRYKGSSMGYSAWSNTVSFVTKEKFSPSTELMKLELSDKATGDQFGYAVDISNMGERAVVGSPSDDIGSNNNAGSVTVFKKNGNTYQQEVKLSAITQGDTAVLSIASGGSVRIQTNSPSLNDQTYTSSQSVSLPSDATEITITGKGGAGTSVYNPGQEYIAPSGPITERILYWQWIQSSIEIKSYPIYSSSIPPQPSYAPSYEGQSVGEYRYSETNGVDWYNYHQCSWVASGYNGPVTGYTNPGQPYIAPTTTYTTGPSTTVTINTKVFTFAGGYGGAANESTQYFYVNTDDGLGKSLGISKDGTTFIAGSPNDSMSNKASNIGTVHIGKYTGTAWNKLTQIASPDTTTTNQYFGYAVAIDATGTRVAISRVMSTSTSSRVYIYTYNGTAWTLEQTISPPDNYSGMRFGESLALDNTGTTLAVGSPASGGTGSDSSTYIYTRSGVTWTQQARVKPTTANSSTSNLGISVALSGDGNTLVTGDNLSGVTGCFNIFTRSGATWTQLEKLSSSDTSKQVLFGRTVSISEDGNIITVGDTKYKNASDTEVGAVIIFTKGPTNYTQEKIIFASDGTANSDFSISQSLSPDGGTLLVGASNTTSQTGSAYLYQ